MRVGKRGSTKQPMYPFAVIVLLCDGGDALDEIVDTTTRRQENMQNVPISVIVVNQERIASRGINTSDAIALLTPVRRFGS
jgi:outer membrane receptor protein involved in Fe transport